MSCVKILTKEIGRHYMTAANERLGTDDGNATFLLTRSF